VEEKNITPEEIKTDDTLPKIEAPEVDTEERTESEESVSDSNSEGAIQEPATKADETVEESPVTDITSKADEEHISSEKPAKKESGKPAKKAPKKSSAPVTKKDEGQSTTAYDPDKPRKVDTLFDFIELFVFTLLAVIIITSFFVRHSIVEGDSMLDTLHDGEALIISDLFYEPDYLDIVVCEDYSTVLKKPIIKRVIALEGDKVRITKDAIYVNGEKLDEPYVFIDEYGYEYDTFPTNAFIGYPNLKYVPEKFFEFDVPEDKVFVMGDHRNRSTDSREIGAVEVDSILGRVIFRLTPFDKMGPVE